MDQDTLSRIFDPFFTTKFVGRGLSLTTALGILKAHNGAMSAESRLGEGSLFEVFLPVARPRVPQPKLVAPPPRSHPTPGESIVLLVDDEAVLRETVSELLHILGYKVIEAVDGMEALETFKKRKEDITLVLMDLTMPRMDGREAFQAMRQIDPQVPVILSSGYTEQDATRDLVGSGLGAFLQKPYRLRDLEAALNSVLGKTNA
jgi:CheY-like chemotaxis protein